MTKQMYKYQTPLDKLNVALVFPKQRPNGTDRSQQSLAAKSKLNIQ